LRNERACWAWALLLYESGHNDIAVVAHPEIRQYCRRMRQKLTPDDESYLLVRSLAIDYAAGGREERHSHAWPQFLYARSGAIRAEIDGKWWAIPPRRGLWIPSGVEHCLYMSSKLQLRTLYFSPAFAADRNEIEAVNVSGLLHEALLRVCEQGSLDARYAADRSLSEIILSEVESRDTSTIALTVPADPRARKLSDLFLNNEHEHQAAKMDALCAQAGLSRRTAERLFLHETGLPPAQWRRFAALTESLVHIAGGKRIEYAAFSAGYQSRSAFSEAFTRAFGIPPSEAR
jgi:AraC-like DNA-binding protein/quercetin dioxygenase-like cupin family protein